MLPKGPYNAQTEEPEILKFWLDNNFYAPEYTSTKKLSTAANENRDSFSIALPPPNANGNLHLGHMSGYAYQDIMGRFNRMQGKKVLLLPGKDHAGIQSEVVFEEELEKQGRKKQDLGREEFYKQCYEFCIKNAANARRQEQNIGLSADFGRELFTLDPRIVSTVLETFILMYQDKLLYRGKRLINWCPRCQSALADIDTEFKDSETKFVYFKYGFLEPEPFAVEVKKKYSGENVDWTYERSKTKDGKRDLPYAYGEVADFKNPNDGDNLDVIGIGYGDNLKPGAKLKGKAIGIQMRLDKNYNLLVVSEDYTGDLQKDLAEIFKFAQTIAAGSHFLLFEEHPNDADYTNGFVIGTVRPETIFGDTAIAVDPDDKRYADLVGQTFKVKSLDGTLGLKLISDNAVEQTVGSGALKITPAHAFEDWDIAQRHPETLPEKQCIDFDGKLNHLAGKYKGIMATKAREQVIEDMKTAGMIVHIDENYTNRIRICERCKHQIEPLVSYQWFVDTKPLKEKAKKLVEKGHTVIMPEGKKKTYMEWMNSKEDWCITRQLWWGYRVPVWYKGKAEEFVDENGEVKERIAGKTIETMNDYNEIMRVTQYHPNISELDLVLIPGKHGFIQPYLYKKLKELNGNAQEADVSNLTEPTYADYKEGLSKIKFSKDTIVIAHSIGCIAAINYLLENKIKVKALILLAPSTETSTSIETWRKAGFWNMKSDFKDINNLTERSLIIHSNDDPNSTPEGFVGLKDLLGEKTEIYMEPGKQHFYGPDYGLDSEKFFEILNSYAAEVNNDWQQDEDVLDTWFSSGQWPYVTLKVKAGDYANFYPTNVMETGWDILLFWVTRMMLLCPYRLEKEGITDEAKQVPFQNVYLHGLVLDKNGIKMSKSKKNGIDPFEMMQKYGTDALRISFVIGNSAGQNYRLYEEKIASYRNFCNKIWNASKFALMNIEGNEKEIVSADPEKLKLTKNDTEFIEHLNSVIKDTSRRITGFNFGIAAQELYDSFWHTFADVYVETIKSRLYTKDKEGNPINTSAEAKESRLAAQWVIYKSIETYIKMLHPFIPFITERIWRDFPKQTEESETLMYSMWPTKLK